MSIPGLDRRPVIVAVAGPNGAGKFTFYHAHLAAAGLRFVNADVIARELELDAYGAAGAAEVIRHQLVQQGESFVFETVFSDPVGDKLTFLKDAASRGYNIILCYIGLADAATSEHRVAMRVSQGGHDVPTDKLTTRFPRTLANLKRAICELPRVFIFDNSDLRTPFRRVAIFEDGALVFSQKPFPKWLRTVMK